MNKSEIQKKVIELQDILSNFRGELSQHEKELSNVISQYRKAVEEEKINELRQTLNTNEQ